MLARINRNGDINDTATPNPLVTLAEFFEGNNDPGSNLVRPSAATVSTTR